jgi:hypothetical protein
MVVERINMGQLNLGKENEITITKTHAEILEMIEEIKHYENKYKENDFELTNFDEDVVDFDSDIQGINEVEKNIVHFVEIDKNKLEQYGLVRSSHHKKKKTKKRIRCRFFKKKNSKIKEIKTINPTIFKLRINNEGNLINTELKEAIPPAKSKKSSILKKINIKILKKSKKEKSKNKSKKLKFKGSLGKLSKLKKAIPNIGKKQETKEIPEGNE